MLGEIEEGWWRGRLNEKEGVFPSNFVEEMPPNPLHKKSLGGSKDNLTHLAGENELLHHAVVPSLPPKPGMT